MSVEIAMSKVTYVSLVEFEQVAPHGDPYVFGAECPNQKELSKSGEARIVGVSNTQEKLATCREKVEGEIILCDGCTAQFYHTKTVMEGGESGEGEEFIYLAEGDEPLSTQSASCKDQASCKDKAIKWVKAHPVLAALTGVAAVLGIGGAAAGLAFFDSRVNPCDKLSLELDIFNPQSLQDIKVNTTQTYLSGKQVNKTHTVPKMGQTRLKFDLRQGQHKEVKVSYTNYFNPPLSNSGYSPVPTTYNFTESLLNKNNGSCSFIIDKNADGKLSVSHTLYANNGYYMFGESFEDTNGKTTQPLVTKPLHLTIKSQSTNDKSVYIKIGERDRAGLENSYYYLKVGDSDQHEIKAGTVSLTTAFKYTSTGNFIDIDSFNGAQVPADDKGELCFSFSTADQEIGQKRSLRPGKC